MKPSLLSCFIRSVISIHRDIVSLNSFSMFAQTIFTLGVVTVTTPNTAPRIGKMMQRRSRISVIFCPQNADFLDIWSYCLCSFKKLCFRMNTVHIIVLVMAAFLVATTNCSSEGCTMLYGKYCIPEMGNPDVIPCNNDDHHHCQHQGPGRGAVSANIFGHSSSQLRQASPVGHGASECECVPNPIWTHLKSMPE